MARALMIMAALAFSAAPAQAETITYSLLGDGGRAIVRAIAEPGVCPSLLVDGAALPMSLRAAAGTVPARTGGKQAETKPSAFPLQVCEAALPAGARRASIDGRDVPVPSAQPQRIVLIGDTGCRMKQSEDYFQSCEDGPAWPLARVARSAAALHPDLVVHVGDYHYRESRCASSQPGCANSPWGYGFDTWRADVFDPLRPLLTAAPWVFTRGNHETCERAGQGWFRFLDAAPWTATRSCDDPRFDRDADFSTPYAVPLGGGTQLVVFDSSHSRGQAYSETDADYQSYAPLLRRAESLAQTAPRSIFVSHHPVLGLAPGANAVPKASVQGLASVMRGLNPGTHFLPGFDLALHGHVHLFEALSFEGSLPATLVVGNSSSATEGALPTTLEDRHLPYADTVIKNYTTRSGFGFAMLERAAGAGWTVTEFDVNGRALFNCQLEGKNLSCKNATSE
ncbi:metallophosphoesterase family protein [Pseudoduganella sp. RAF53_2]|uniref:metallophosphoesterase family protein n=1 Tax=unclassified Pseudoduganella TaxID=2637179 RepID=UPI003F9764F9